jgi:hypothetical protein
MARPENALTRLHSFNGNIKSKEPVGLSDEFLTECLLDELKLVWMKVDHGKYIYSRELIETHPARRPDYIVFLENAALFIDAKSLAVSTGVGVRPRASLAVDDLKKYQALQKLTGVDVGFIVWDRFASAFKCAWCWLDDLADKGETIDEKPAFSRDFAPEEFGSLHL